MSIKLDNIILAESKETNNFYPFSLMHPIWEIRCGAYMLFEKACLYFSKANLLLSGRKLQRQSFQKRYNFDIKTKLLSNTTAIFDASLVLDVNVKKFLFENDFDAPTALRYKDKIVGLILENIDYKEDFFFEDYLDQNININIIEITNINKLEYLWDALDNVANQISLDAGFFASNFSVFDKKIYDQASAINPDNILIGKDVSIAPNVVLDASEGAIILDDNVKIMPQATIIGPAYIGKNSLIKVGAKIYEDCSIGQFCKVGGELENTIIQAYSNKQHDGFLGHAYLGEWVNFGADTNNSDLKNNYSEIKVNLNGQEINTGRMFLGLLCGDHTKTGINTMFTTGTVCGLAGILVREWFLPNSIPSFSWGGGKKSPIYKIDQAIKTAKIVMKRRNRELLPEEEEILRQVWQEARAK